MAAGGWYFHRRSGAEAAAYLEAGHHEVEYYSEGGVSPGGGIRTLRGGEEVAAVVRTDAESFARWVEGMDPETGVRRGQKFADGEARRSPRYMEHVISVPKELSVLAGVHPGFAAVLDRAMERAADDLDAYVSRVAVGRIRRGGALRRVGGVTVQTSRWTHLTSRAGDPHRHIHWQVSTKVEAPDGQWLALDTATLSRHLGAIKAQERMSLGSDLGVRGWLSAHGLSLALDGKGEWRVPELAAVTDRFSARRDQIRVSKERGKAAGVEAEWRAEHPGREPSQALVNTWDQIGWDDGRARKKHGPVDYVEMQAGWNARLADLGLDLAPESPMWAARAADRAGEGDGDDRGGAGVVETEVDRDRMAREVTAGLAARQSAWSAADVAAAVRMAVVRADVVGERAELGVLVGDVEARVGGLSESVLDLETHSPGSTTRHLTSEQVRVADERMQQALRSLASRHPDAPADDGVVAAGEAAGLHAGQLEAAGRIVSARGLEVVIGPAGSGKTMMAAVLSARLAEQGRSLRVGSPSKKGAQVLAGEIGVGRGESVAAWLYAYGWRWNPETGQRWRLEQGQVDSVSGEVYDGPRAEQVIDARTVLLVDEAGMLSVDEAADLFNLAVEVGADVRLMGDPRQLGAVGRGGVMETAAGWVDGGVELVDVWRFVRVELGPDGLAVMVPDTGYADLSLRLRQAKDPAALAAELVATGHVVVHRSMGEAVEAIAGEAWRSAGDPTAQAITAATRDEARALSDAVRARRVAAGEVDDLVVATGRDGARIGRGDRVVTRRNDHRTEVANRDGWTVTGVLEDGSITVAAGDRTARLDGAYVADQVELGYAVTGHGNQGVTARRSAGLVAEATDAGGVYVMATRGREANVLHVVAVSDELGVEQLARAIGRDRADRGLGAAAEAARSDAESVPTLPLVVSPAEGVGDSAAVRPGAHLDPSGLALPDPATWVTAERLEARRQQTAREYRDAVAAIGSDPRLRPMPVPDVEPVEIRAAKDAADRDALEAARVARGWAEARAADLRAVPDRYLGEWLADRDNLNVIAAGPGRLKRAAGEVARAVAEHEAFLRAFPGWQPIEAGMTDQQVAGHLVAQAQAGVNYARREANDAVVREGDARRRLRRRDTAVRVAALAGPENQRRAAEREARIASITEKANLRAADIEATEATRAALTPEALAAADRAADAWQREHGLSGPNRRAGRLGPGVDERTQPNEELWREQQRQLDLGLGR